MILPKFNPLIASSILMLTSSLLASPFDGNQSNLSSRSFPLDTVIWTNTTIPVCWESLSTDANLRNEVQNAVTTTWEANSQVDFPGWGQCPTGTFTGIRIGVNDVGPYTERLGNELRGRVSGMILNFTFVSWDPNCITNHGLTSCVRWTAVHEFGHALGFAHEQNRHDTPTTCTLEPQGTMGNIIFTDWDNNSVMNYCNPNWNGNGNLSNIDILTVQTYYGNIPRYTSPSKLLEIPVVIVSGVSYTATLDDFDGDNAFSLRTFNRTGNRSSQPARYAGTTLTLPMLKVLDLRNHVESLYSATMNFNGSTFTVSSATQLQPTPITFSLVSH